MDAIEAALAIARTPGLHAGKLRNHPELLADPARLLGGGLSHGIGQGGPQPRALRLGEAAVAWLSAPDVRLLDEDRRWLDTERLTLLRWGDREYPGRLAQIPDAPLVLFVRGPADNLLRPQIAMVGSRHPTPSGRHIAHDFAEWLTMAGLVITSGMARGIDSAAHSGALKVGQTIAVVGTGLDQVYPPENRELHARILDAGGSILSEFPRGMPPLAPNFPRRNRLISGLALGTLVVEAARSSGSLITARKAAEQGREVFAVPGSIHNVQSLGCHALIREGARLTESAVEILEELKIPYEKQIVDSIQRRHAPPGATPPPLDNNYEILLDALGFDPMGVDELIARTGIGSQSLAAMLLTLELSGVVALHTGGRYQRVRRDPARH